MLLVLCILVTGIVLACSRKDKDGDASDSPVKTSEGVLTDPSAIPQTDEDGEARDQQDIATEQFITLVNRVGSKDEVVVDKLGEGTIHRDVATNEVVAREYKVPFLEDEDAVIILEYDDDSRVDEIEIALSSNDIEFYREVLDDMLGGSSKEVTKGDYNQAYQWQRNNISITLAKQGDLLRVYIEKEES